MIHPETRPNSAVLKIYGVPLYPHDIRWIDDQAYLYQASGLDPKVSLRRAVIERVVALLRSAS